MKKTFFAVMLLIAIQVVQAAPTKAAAEAWGQDFKKLRDKTTDAFVLRDAVGAPRSAMRTQLEQLAQRASKMWGDYGDCTRASQSLLTAFDTSFEVVRVGGYIGTSALTRQAFETGQGWAACRSVIDSTK
jgi:hypothetical protein